MLAEEAFYLGEPCLHVVVYYAKLRQQRFEKDFRATRKPIPTKEEAKRLSR